jgi:hypothetical protein
MLRSQSLPFFSHLKEKETNKATVVLTSDHQPLHYNIMVYFSIVCVVGSENYQTLKGRFALLALLVSASASYPS